MMVSARWIILEETSCISGVYDPTRFRCVPGAIQSSGNSGTVEGVAVQITSAFFSVFSTCG